MNTGSWPVPWQPPEHLYRCVVTLSVLTGTPPGGWGHAQHYRAHFTDENTELGEQGIVLTAKPDRAPLHHAALWKRGAALGPAFTAPRQGVLDRIQTEWEEGVTSALVCGAV